MRIDKKWFGLLTACMSLAFALNPADVSAAAKKWHPGHYMLKWANTGTKPFEKIINNPNFEGGESMHLWRELEKEKGVYNFNSVVNELNYLKARKKRLMLIFQDKDWGGKSAPCVPDYMLKDPKYMGGQVVVRNKNGTVNMCMAKRWVPAVMDRMIALYTALGNRFDGEPYFEAIKTTENSAISGGGFSIAAHTAQLKRQMLALAKVFPRTQVFQGLNWVQKEISVLFPYAHSIGIGVGGPDILPTHPTEAYPYYRQYSGKMPLAIDGQNNGVSPYLRSGAVDFEDLYTFAITDPRGLRVNYVIWSSSENGTWSFQNNVIPLVNRHKGYINGGCPLNISCQ